MSSLFPIVAKARPPQIDNRQLENLRRVAHDTRHGLADAALVEWLLFCTGDLLDELAIRRAWMDGNAPHADLNVIALRNEARA